LASSVRLNARSVSVAVDGMTSLTFASTVESRAAFASHGIEVPLTA
jgi:hypothetical protein